MCTLCRFQVQRELDQLRYANIHGLVKVYPRARHAGGKMEPMLVGNFMEKAGVFKLRAWSMISRKRGCFQEATSMD